MKPVLILLCCAACEVAFGADEKTAEAQSVRFRVMGLFAPDRENDLREAAKQLPDDVKLTGVDYASSEATFSYDPAGKTLKGANPDQVQQRINAAIADASRHTFSLKPLITTPREKLENVEITVAGLDCKACAYGAYRILSNIEGVERATVSFKAGLATALINPEKTNRTALIKALKQREIAVKE